MQKVYSRHDNVNVLTVVFRYRSDIELIRFIFLKTCSSLPKIHISIWHIFFRSGIAEIYAAA